MNDVLLTKKISQLESLIGSPIKIYTDKYNYFNTNRGPKLLIQDNNVIAIHISDQKAEILKNIIQFFSDILYLRLSRCDLGKIPPEIVKLSNLRDLDLGGNHIRTVPDYICQLSSLKVLHLSHNEISALPDNIGALSHLEGLFLDRNQITLLPPSLSNCSALKRIGLLGNPLVSLAGIPPSCDFPDIDIELAAELLTFKGCVLTQFHAIECAMENDYADIKRVERGNFQFSYHGPLAELPLTEIPRFIEQLFGSDFVSFPYLPPPELRYPKNPWQPGKILPEFRDFLTAFLEHITDFAIDSWREYYARHTVDLGRSYITDRSLSEDDFERLVHECDFRLYNFLKNHLPSSDPLLQELGTKFSIETNNQSLFL